MFTVSTGELEMRKELLKTEHILNIENDVATCWFDLGIALGIRTKILRGIEDYRPNQEKAHQVLEIWQEQNGREATVGRLASALMRIKHKRIADKLLGMYMVFLQ